MALYSFAYDEPLTCRVCGNDDFTFLKPIARLRCNNCKASYTEQDLVEEAIETMSDYIRHHGIAERLPMTAPRPPADYSNTNTLAALAAALQVLSYPELTTEANLTRARSMVLAALSRERFKQEQDV